MKSIQEQAKNIPVAGEFDLIVCGGGPAGFSAAVAAADQGARTLMIERYGYLGGTGTAALMVEFGSMYDGVNVELGGITHDFLHSMVDFGGALMPDEKTHQVVYDPESMIAVCQNMAEAAGVELLFHTLVCETIMAGNTAIGVIVENKAGRQAYLGKAIIDATGDGDVAARAGAEFHLGRETDGKTQPATLVVLVGNVNTVRVGEGILQKMNGMITNAKKVGEWPLPTDQFFSMKRVLKRGQQDDPEQSFFFLNVTNALHVDGLNANDLTRAEIETRKQVEPLIQFMRGYVPGFEDCYLDRTAAQVGIRETRRIIGDYTLTGEEVLAATHFDDGIAPSHQTIDVHDVEGKVFEHGHLKNGSHYEVPYRCLLPKGIDGLLVSGRCISVDHYALGSVRRMVTCMPVGEACGIAAAQAITEDIPVREVNVDSVRHTLRKKGTLLGC